MSRLYDDQSQAAASHELAGRQPCSGCSEKRICDLLQDLAHSPSQRPISTMAQTSHLSASRLRHVVKDAIGIPPIAYLKHRRLHQARSLMVGTLLRVKEVMAKVGINDPSHFARDYKALFGETPSETRARFEKAVWEQNKPITSEAVAEFLAADADIPAGLKRRRKGHEERFLNCLRAARGEMFADPTHPWTITEGESQ